MDSQGAAGIPDRSKFTDPPEVAKPRPMELSIQRHQADRAGLHYDLRIGDPASGIAHSWALRREPPKPGEKPMIVVQQPDHSMDYLDFAGEIPEGYGKGLVDLYRRGKVETYHSEANKIKFNDYSSRVPQEYILRRLSGDYIGRLQAQGALSSMKPGRAWLLQNVTKTRAGTGLEIGKPSYREQDYESLDPDDSAQIWTKKMDGAHVLIPLEKDRIPRIYSHQSPTDPAHLTGLLEHTHKVQDVLNSKVPAELGGTLLRAEIYARDKDGKVIEPEQLGGILNASVERSRQIQQELGIRMELMPFDLVRFQGKDVRGLPYAEKLRLLQEVNTKMPMFRMVPSATTPQEKKEMAERIRRGVDPDTKEGIVAWDDIKGPIKAKVLKEYDLPVVGTFPGEGRLSGVGIGGLLVETGPGMVARVGTGFTDAQRKVFMDPSTWQGKVARIHALRMFPATGKLRAPSFQGFHLEKGRQDPIEVATAKETV